MFPVRACTTKCLALPPAAFGRTGSNSCAISAIWGLPELTRRWQEARQLIRENGVTYNVYGDPRGMDRPWQLDPMPLLISPGRGPGSRGRPDPAWPAAGGNPRRPLRCRRCCCTTGCCRRNWSSPIPAFLRPCRGIHLPGDRFLHLYAVNLGRSPDGNLWVLGDRTQSPSGAGYALENRIVLSRMLPDAFRDCRVQRLALFFRTLRDTLRSIAPHNRDNPRIVLLDAGPVQRNLFRTRLPGPLSRLHARRRRRSDRARQQVFLERAGRPAAGRRDLSPARRRLLRSAGAACRLVPGRAGPGAGGAGRERRRGQRPGQRPARNARPCWRFCPRLCRHFLGEDCSCRPCRPGGAASRRRCDYVLDASDPTWSSSRRSRRMRRELIFTSQLSPEKLQALAAQIRARPRNFVGQERLPLSTTPVLAGSTAGAAANGHAHLPGGPATIPSR